MSHLGIRKVLLLDENYCSINKVVAVKVVGDVAVFKIVCDFHLAFITCLHYRY